MRDEGPGRHCDRAPRSWSRGTDRRPRTQSRAPLSSEQAVPTVRIKALLNLALNRVGEFAARALEIACDFVLGLLQPRRDQRVKQTPQQPGPRSPFCST